MIEQFAITLCIGGIAWIHQHLYWRLYQKTSGHAAPKRSANQSIGVLVATGCAMGFAMLGSAPWALGTWAASTAGIVAVLIPGRKVEDVLHTETAQHLEQRLVFKANWTGWKVGTDLTRFGPRRALRIGIGQDYRTLRVDPRHHRKSPARETMPMQNVSSRFLPGTCAKPCTKDPCLSPLLKPEYIQTHFDLMHSRQAVDFVRHRRRRRWMTSRVEAHGNILLSDWAQRTLWPYFQLAERSSNFETPSSKWTFLAMNSCSLRPSPVHVLPEGSHNEHIEHRFTLLGTERSTTGITSRVEEALYA